MGVSMVDFSESDRELLDRYIRRSLARYRSGEMDQTKLHDEMKQAFLLLASNKSRFRAHLLASVDTGVM
jgi:hypothetical protein